MSKRIENNQQYEAALARTYALMQKNIHPDSQESDELKMLAILITEFENEHYPIPIL